MAIDYSDSDDGSRYRLSNWRTSATIPSVGRTLPSLATLPGFLRLAIAFAVIPLLVDGLVPQLEMAAFGGNIPIRINFYAFAGLLVLWGLIREKFYSSALSAPALSLTLFLVVDAIYLIANVGVSAGEILRASLAAFAILLFASVALSLRIGISEKLIVRLILLMLLANFVVQVMQFEKNTPILSEQSKDQNWRVDSDKYIDGTQRAFGLFSNGLDAGVFCAFTGALGAAYCRKRSRVPAGVAIMAISAFGCYATFTRVTLIALIAAWVSVFLLKPRFRKSPIRLLPLIWGGVAVLLLGIAVIYPSLGNGLDNSTSTLVRLHAWYVSFQRFSASSLSEKLLGSGTASGLHVRPGQDLTRYLPFSIDNLLISQSLYFGLMALIPSLFFIWKAWRFLLS